MRSKLVNSQIGNYKTYQMYLRQMLTLAENVFEFSNLPKYIDEAYMNKVLLRQGSIAFFKDEVLGLLALPFSNIGNLDLYGRPNKIQVYGLNGYNRTLTKDEFVIMYDNNGRYPIFLDICQYAERVANETRTIDINISQQKTPRFWKTSTEKEKSVRDILNSVDGNENAVLTYDNLNLDETVVSLAPAPYVADKVQIQKQNDWSEFLRLIGVSNLAVQKKERNIIDEIQAQQGGTVASRYSRFEPRKKAIEEINEKFKLEKPIEVRYYDKEPSTNKNDNQNTFIEESDVIDNV